MKGKTYLLVSGILLVIGGAMGVFVYGLMALIMGVSAVPEEGAATGAILIVVSLLALIVSIFNLVAGIMGIRGRAKAEKADVLFKIGIVLLVLSLISSVSSLASAGVTLNGVASVLASLVIPAVFTFGAKLNKAA